MKKIINTHSAVLAVAMLILSLSASISGQSYQGCQQSESWSRMDFEFKPVVPNADWRKEESAKVLLKPDEKIGLVLKKVDLSGEKPNQPGQRAAGYEFEEPLRNMILPTDYVYALIYNGNNYRQELSANNGVFTEKYFPPIDSPDSKQSAGKVVKLSLNANREAIFDSAGMPEGFYWIVLQGKVRFAGQTAESCDKTTSPVLIQIKDDIPPPPPRPPTVQITSIEGKECNQRTITAVVESLDNQPNSGREPRSLTLTWLINGQNVGEKPLGEVASYTDRITTEGLTPGEYTVEVRVKDSVFSAFNRRTFSLGCSGAGIVYIQFDEPYQPLRDAKRGIPFNYDPYQEPNEWGIYRLRRGQCRSGKLRPDAEFLPFYNEGYATLPKSMEENKTKLDTIGRLLQKDSEIMLYILGYADFKNDLTYNKYLVDRRIGAVMKYLKDNYGITEDRLVGGKAINNSNKSAVSMDEDPCSDGRMHDRRVELIYFKRGTVVTPPSYSEPIQE